MKPLYHLWNCTGSRSISRHRRLAQAGAAYLKAQGRPIICKVYVEFPRGVLGFEIDETRRAIEAAGACNKARRVARLPDRGLYGPGSSTRADIVGTLGKR